MERADLAREGDEATQVLHKPGCRRFRHCSDVRPPYCELGTSQRVGNEEWSSRTCVRGAAPARLALFLVCLLVHAAILAVSPPMRLARGGRFATR